MEITWLGASCFLLKNHIGKRILLDPFIHNHNQQLSSISPNIITISHNHFDVFILDKFRDSCTIINSDTIYENDFCKIEGFKSFHDNKQGMKRGKNIIYKITMDNLSICHLGDLGHMISSEIISLIGNIDVLFVPIGGHISLNGETSAKLTKLINPRFVFPMHYRTPCGPNYLNGPQEFIKKMNVETTIQNNPFIISNKDTSEKTQLIILDYKDV